MYLKEVERGFDFHSCGSGQGPVEDPCERQCTSGIHTILGIYVLAEQLLASQE
jgi:hypothetical protein